MCLCYCLFTIIMHDASRVAFKHELLTPSLQSQAGVYLKYPSKILSFMK